MDYLVCLFLLVMVLTSAKLVTFIFGVTILWALTPLFNREREFKNRLLPAFLVTSMVMILPHLETDLIGVYPINTYLNVWVMSSGIASLLLGAMLGKIIIEYHKTLVPYFFTLLVMLFNFTGAISRSTMFFALMVSLGIYGLINKKWLLPMFCFASGVVYFVLKYTTLMVKITARINGWDEAIHQIIQHPFFGQGFVYGFVPMNMVYAERQRYGWVFIHNDFLGLARFIGVIPVILIVAFLLKELWKLRNDWRFVMFGTVLLAISFQTMMFDTYKAVVVVAIMALAISRNYGGSDQDCRTSEQGWEY